MSQKTQKTATAPVAGAAKTEEKATAKTTPVAAAATTEAAKKAAAATAESEKKTAEAKAATDAATAEANAKKKAELQIKKEKLQQSGVKKELTVLETVKAAFTARKKVYSKQMSVAQMEQAGKDFVDIVRKVHVSKSDEVYEALLAYITSNATQVSNVIKIMNEKRCSVAERNSVAMMMAAMTRIAQCRRAEEPVKLNVAAIRMDCQYQQLANFLTSKNDG